LPDPVYNVINTKPTSYLLFGCCRTRNPNNICIRSPTLHATTITITIIILIAIVLVAIPIVAMKISYVVNSDTYDMNTGCKKGAVWCVQTLVCYGGVGWIICILFSYLASAAVVLMSIFIFFMLPIGIWIGFSKLVILCRDIYLELIHG